MMLSELFYWVLNMSVIGGLTGLIVALLRKIPKFPTFAAYLLWALVLIRLWIPLGIANRWSLLHFISKYTTKTVVIWEGVSRTPDLTMSNSIQAAESYFPIVYKTALLDNIFEVASIIWAIVATVAVLVSLYLYVANMKELRGARHLKDNIWTSKIIAFPAVYGIFNAKIILPHWVAEEDVPFILAHENVHIRRLDNLWRVIAIITACVHWFNPLSWMFLRLFFLDMELSCDTKVLKTLSANHTKIYAETLLNIAAGKQYFVSAFGSTNTRLRIENILSYKKLTLLSTLALSAFITAVAFVLITNAVGG